jgi:hypothetical protein
VEQWLRARDARQDRQIRKRKAPLEERGFVTVGNRDYLPWLKLQRLRRLEGQNSFCGDVDALTRGQDLRACASRAPSQGTDRSAFASAGNGADDCAG